MNTKARIADEALTLFSSRGYDGVTVKEIAKAVGIKDSSLYKHYTGKQDIFESIIGQMETRLAEMHTILSVPDARKQNVAKHFSEISTRSFTEMAEKMFLFYLEDHVVGRLRRLFTIEQYKNTEIGHRFGNMFIDAALDYNAEVFRQMIGSGAFIAADPQQMALEFYAPIFLLLCRADIKPETKQQSVEILKKHVQAFGRRYTTSEER